MKNYPIHFLMVLSCTAVLALAPSCKPVRHPEGAGDSPTVVKTEKNKPTQKVNKTVVSKTNTMQRKELRQIPAPADVAAPPKDAVVTNSGLASKVLKAGSGSVHPAPTDTVKVNYTGWTTDGKMFDSSVSRNRPATFPLNRVIPGWTEGVGLMVVGEKRRLWIPEKLAYKGRPGRPQGMLVFDVELMDIIKPPATPKDVAGPGKDTKKTNSGISYKIIKKGQGTEHPTSTSVVQVNYTGWTTDGKMFDSSVTRGKPAVFPLNRVIPGWTEGVQLMVEGDTMRFWIPEQLAYKGRAGAPKGMLVFDVELLKILK